MFSCKVVFSFINGHGYALQLSLRIFTGKREITRYTLIATLQTKIINWNTSSAIAAPAHSHGRKHSFIYPFVGLT